MQNSERELEHSFGIICRHEGKYLLYNKSNNQHAFHKGHFELSDTFMTQPYSGFKITPVSSKYDYPFEISNCPSAMVVAGVRELMEESGFILPSQLLKSILKQKYFEQGKLLMHDNNIPFVQEKSGKKLRKRVGFFFAQLSEAIPRASLPKNQSWYSLEQVKELHEKGQLRPQSYDFILTFQQLFKENQ